MTDTMERETILASELEQERAQNRDLRRQLSELTDSITKPIGPTCRHCHKPIHKVNADWRDAEWLTFCGVGDSRHSLDIGAGETQRIKMVRQ